MPESVELSYAPFGLVQGEDGKRLKSRSGEAVPLKELLDEAIARTRRDIEQRLKLKIEPNPKTLSKTRQKKWVSARLSTLTSAKTASATTPLATIKCWLCRAIPLPT